MSWRKISIKRLKRKIDIIEYQISKRAKHGNFQNTKQKKKNYESGGEVSWIDLVSIQKEFPKKKPEKEKRKNTRKLLERMGLKEPSSLSNNTEKNIFTLTHLDKTSEILD
jgi:ribosomal protein S8E